MELMLNIAALIPFIGAFILGVLFAILMMKGGGPPDPPTNGGDYVISDLSRMLC